MEYSLFTAIVYSPEEVVINESSIVLRKIACPSIGELYTNLYDAFEGTMPENFCVYWRYSPKKFMPIYDYVTYKTALSLMGEKRFYAVLNSSNEKWEIAKHPFYSHKPRKYDVNLLSLLSPPEEVSELFHGYTLDEVARREMILNLLKGVPHPYSCSKEPSSSTKGSKKNKSETNGKKTKKSVGEIKSKKGGKIGHKK